MPNEQADPDNWFSVDQALLERRKGAMPADFDRLTLTEIEFLLADPAKHDPDGTPAMSDAEIIARVAWRQSLTSAEKLEYGD